MNTIIKDINTALSIFESEAIKQSVATHKGDYKSGNKSYTKIIKSAQFLKKEGALEKLSIFLDNPNNNIRIWAASFLLPIYEKESVKTLKEISKITDIDSLTAETTLTEWKKGNLNL